MGHTAGYPKKNTGKGDKSSSSGKILDCRLCGNPIESRRRGKNKTTCRACGKKYHAD